LVPEGAEGDDDRFLAIGAELAQSGNKTIAAHTLLLFRLTLEAASDDHHLNSAAGPPSGLEQGEPDAQTRGADCAQTASPRHDGDIEMSARGVPRYCTGSELLATIENPCRPGRR
jgi:hypothetical protein